MPNVNAPLGLRPVRHYMGGQIRLSEYNIASALGSNIYRGSLVKTSPGTSKRIDVAAAGNTVIGVFMGCYYQDSSGDYQFKPNWVSGTTTLGSADAKAIVIDDPFVLYEIQVSGSAGLVATDIGNVADAVISTGSTLTGNSGDMLDQSTLSASGSAQLKIVDLVRRDDNAFGQYAKALVLINEHEFNLSSMAAS